MWDARGYKPLKQDQLFDLIARAKYSLGKETSRALNDFQVAAVLGVSISTFKRWKYNAHALPYWAFKALTLIAGDNNVT